MSITSRISSSHHVLTLPRVAALALIPLAASTAHASAVNWHMSGSSLQSPSGGSGGTNDFATVIFADGLNGSNANGLKIWGDAGPAVGEAMFSNILVLSLWGGNMHPSGETQSLGVFTDIDLNVVATQGVVRVMSALVRYDMGESGLLQHQIDYPGGHLIGPGGYSASLLTPTSPGVFTSGSWLVQITLQWDDFAFDAELSITVPNDSIDIGQRVVPAPGAAVLGVLACSAGLRRRRR